METRTSLVLAVHVYERQMLWYVMDRPAGRRRRVMSRGQITFAIDEGPLDEYEALLEVALEAYRLHGR